MFESKSQLRAQIEHLQKVADRATQSERDAHRQAEFSAIRNREIVEDYDAQIARIKDTHKRDFESKIQKATDELQETIDSYVEKEKRINSERDKILSDARKEGEKILKEAIDKSYVIKKDADAYLVTAKTQALESCKVIESAAMNKVFGIYETALRDVLTVNEKLGSKYPEIVASLRSGVDTFVSQVSGLPQSKHTEKETVIHDAK